MFILLYSPTVLAVLMGGLLDPQFQLPIIISVIGMPFIRFCTEPKEYIGEDGQYHFETYVGSVKVPSILNNILWMTVAICTIATQIWCVTQNTMPVTEEEYLQWRQTMSYR